MKRIVTALGTAALALVLVLPVQAAAHSTSTTTSTLFGSSLNCQYREQPDCVNVVVSIAQDSLGAALFCVGVADFHEAHAPFANGCTELSPAQLTVEDTGVTVNPVDVPATYTADCYMAIPEDNCVPGTLVLAVSASFSAIGSPETDEYKLSEGSGPCTTTASVTSTRVNVVGSVTIDGFTYDLSGTDPSLHHFEAWLERESVRSRTKCAKS